MYHKESKSSTDGVRVTSPYFFLMLFNRGVGAHVTMGQLTLLNFANTRKQREKPKSCNSHLSLVGKIVPKSNLQSLKFLKLRHILDQRTTSLADDTPLFSLRNIKIMAKLQKTIFLILVQCWWADFGQFRKWPLSNVLTTTIETSQNSSKWSHYSTDHKKYNVLSIR